MENARKKQFITFALWDVLSSVMKYHSLQPKARVAPLSHVSALPVPPAVSHLAAVLVLGIKRCCQVTLVYYIVITAPLYYCSSLSVPK